MKNKVLIVTFLSLLFQGAVTVNAQLLLKDTILPPKVEQVEVRQGKLRYLRTYSNMLERMETKSLEKTGKSYESFYFNITPEHQTQIINPLVRSVFSKERAKQLAGLIVWCQIAFSPVENKMLHFG